MKAAVLGALLIAAAFARESGIDEAELIHIDIGVVRNNAESVAGLIQTDFDLLVDGQPRAVETFSSARRPVALVLLLDVTGSMYLTHTTYRFGQSWSSPLQSGDRVVVGSIARPLRLGTVFSDDRRVLQKWVDEAFRRPLEERSGPSPVWDAVDQAIGTLRAEALARQSVIAVTDGMSTGNAVGFNDLVMRAIAAGVSVSVVYASLGKRVLTVPQNQGADVEIRAEPVLLKLVDETGGLFRDSGEGPYANPEPHVEKIIRWLHEGYVVGFSPPVRDGKMHKIDIKVKRPGLVVLARKAFLAPAPPASKPD